MKAGSLVRWKQSQRNSWKPERRGIVAAASSRCGEEALAAIAAYEKSGLTQREFALREGIKFFTFTAWLKRLAAHAEARVCAGEAVAAVSQVGTDRGVAERPGDPGQRDRGVGGFDQAARMLSFNPTQRIDLALEPVDMRKQFNGLVPLAKERLEEDPFDGALFVFTNKEKDRIKDPVLGWDRSVGSGEAPGEGTVYLADDEGPAEDRSGASGFDDALGRNRTRRSPQKSMV